ncbi:hypothetical protein GCM10007086_31730 [Photobacterium aphoticum]|nr:hypothetical protein GCM10007086_31730 [Photobacterium aphoticum]
MSLNNIVLANYFAGTFTVRETNINIMTIDIAFEENDCRGEERRKKKEERIISLLQIHIKRPEALDVFLCLKQVAMHHWALAISIMGWFLRIAYKQNSTNHAPLTATPIHAEWV